MATYMSGPNRKRADAKKLAAALTKMLVECGGFDVTVTHNYEDFPGGSGWMNSRPVGPTRIALDVWPKPKRIKRK